MEITASEPLQIDDGMHDGNIIQINYRWLIYKGNKINYTDLVILFKQKGKAITLNASYPTCISQGSKLGKLLMRFGEPKIVGGVKYNPDKLKDKKVSFQTITEDTERGKFAKVVADSVKPRK